MEECDVKVLLAGAGVAAEIGLPALKQVFDRWIGKGGCSSRNLLIDKSLPIEY